MPTRDNDRAKGIRPSEAMRTKCRGVIRPPVVEKLYDSWRTAKIRKTRKEITQRVRYYRERWDRVTAETRGVSNGGRDRANEFRSSEMKE